MFGNTFETDLLKLIFQNIDAALVGDAGGLRGSVVAGSLYVSLHTADPGEAGTQATSEVVYTGYARVAVVRSAGGWTVAANQVSNTAAIVFGERTDVGSADVQWVGVGTDAAGAGKMLARFPIGAAAVGKEFTAAASTDLFRVPGHTLVVDDRVVMSPKPESTFPGGVTEGTVYWVTIVATDDITLSLTQAGASIDVTTNGSGVMSKMGPVTVSQGTAPQILASQLIGQLD